LSTTTPSTTREGSALTSLTGLSSRSGRQGCWQCLPVQPWRAPPPAPLWPLPLLQRRQPVQCSPALQRPPLLLRRRLQAPCSLEQQGAGAPSAPGALPQWGLGYDSQWVPPLCPTRLRRLDQRAPSAAPPASKEAQSSASELERLVLDYITQDVLPLEAWSQRPSISSSPSCGRGCVASVAAQPD
jgi:hypothetical protein